MPKFRRLLALLLGLALLCLTACAAGPNNVASVGTTELAGFWLGLWQGFICPITFMISLFNHNVSIYEVHNDGNWYNFGFVLGAGILFGGSSGTTSSRR